MPLPLQAALIGIVTGLLSSWPVFFFTPIPGFLFGMNFLTWRRASGAKGFAAILAGAAYHVAMIVGARGEKNEWAFTLASMIGATLLWVFLVSTRVVEAKLRGFCLTLLLSVLASLPFMMVKEGGKAWWSIAFILWQAGMAAWLAYLAEKKVTEKGEARRDA